MPVYACKIRGSKKPRIVVAKTASQAAKHVVEVDPISAEELAAEVAKGTVIETAGAADAPAAEGSEDGSEGDDKTE